MMKTKLLFAGLVASAALVGCTNDELFETQQAAPSVAKGETTLVFNGLGGVGTRMAYDGEKFLWQADPTNKENADQIGVRRINGVEVITNTMFWACGTSDKNEGDPETDWTGTKGKYAFFKSNDETLHEADYIVTYPYDKESVQDGKVTGKLNTAQVVTADADRDNTYAGENNFMMSTATHMTGGQSTNDFDLYPVFTRLAFNITESTNKTEDVLLQSIILKNKDGKAIFPTKLEVNADVKATSEGLLDEASMKALTNDMADEIVLTLPQIKLSDKAVTRYMTIIPGTYEGLEVEFITNQGSYTYELEAAKVVAESGKRHNLTIDIPTLKANRDYVVASATDWKQALSNIKDLKDADADNVTIKVIKDIVLPAEALRYNSLISDQKLTVFGEGSITVDGDWKKCTGAETNTLATTEFQVPVTVKGNFEGMVEGENLTFSELNVEGDFVPANGSNYESITVKKGTVKGATTYHTQGTDEALTMENVEFTGLVKVSAMQANGNDADKKTTKVNFNNCSFTGGLTVADEFTGATAVTVNGGLIVNEDGDAELYVGYKTGSNAYASTVYVKGDVIADIVTMSENQNAAGTLDIIGSLTINNTINYDEAKSLSEILVEQDATLTLGEDATFTVNSPKAAQIEGSLVNNGILTVIVDANNALADIDHNNKHLGTLQNNGLLFVPVTKWYENQYIELKNAANSVYAITSVNDVDAFEAALEIEGVNGVQLTGSNYDFEAESDYSNVNIYTNATTIALKAPKCVFGDMTIAAGNEVTLDNGATAATTFGTVNVYGTLTIDSDLEDDDDTTLAGYNVYVYKGGVLNNGTCVDAENNFQTVQGGTIKY